MAEETKDVGRTLPGAVILSIVISAILFILVFLVVNLSLIRLKKENPLPDIAFCMPNWIPLAGALSSVLLLGAELIN